MEDSRTSNVQLENLAKKLNIPVNDITNKDLLHINPPKEGGYIVNLQDSEDGDGSHWVALWLENPNKAAYMDSFAVVPPLDVIDYCYKFNCKEILVNDKTIQRLEYGRCGQYCLSFLHAMSKNRRKKLETRFQTFLNKYKSELE